MLFSDIEGSSSLLRRLDDRYGEALSAQRELLRAGISAHDGVEMGTEGDSFYVVFESAADAVGCCVAAQRALADHDWPGGVAVRVRMGLHSGEPVRHEGAYVGLDVNRAARIAATAHGGQIVLSEATRVLVQPRLAADLSVRDLGFHRLKDIEAPEHLYQLVVAGLQREFPPLRSLGAETSLPTPMTPLIGREGDLEQLSARLAGPGVRLVTLTGAGGVGKTRLALAAASALARAFPHGIFFVALAAVRDGDVMWKTLARDLDVDGDSSEAVIEHLRGRHALLVLDNLEQLHGAAEVVARLLAAAPHLVVLATSRGPLHIQGEHEVPVSPLSTPQASRLEDVAGSAAVQLFVQQARLVRPTFALDSTNAGDVAAICRRLDGLPLAIELAASRVKLLAPKALLARLGHSLALGTVEVGRPSRHQTLRATIAWSYELLSEQCAAVLRRAGVFAGGFDLEALESVSSAGDGPTRAADPLGLVDELLDVGLVAVSEGAGGEPRFRIPEVIREFALEQLVEAGELDGVRRAHARYYGDYAERLGTQLQGPGELEALDQLETEHDNLRGALAWSLDRGAAPQPDDDERAVNGLRLVAALAYFWYEHGHAVEGRRWLQQAMDVASATGGAPLAKVAHGLGILLDQLDEPEAARQLFERGLAIWGELGERGEEAKELNSLGIVHRHLGEMDAARSHFERSIAISRQLATPRLAAALLNLGGLESAMGNFDRAAAAMREALTLDELHGDGFGVALDRHALALLSLRAGEPSEALEHLLTNVGYVASSGNAHMLANTLELFAGVLATLGEALPAARLAGAAQAIRASSGIPSPESELRMLDTYLDPARATVTPENWAAAVDAGRALGQNEAAALLVSLATERGVCH
jgi:predicted ATPase/class 3 adenylate cyclase